MAHAHNHTLSSLRKQGGDPNDPQDYAEHFKLHQWMDESKRFFAGPAHRMLRHHTQGCFDAEAVFGTHITMRSGQKIAVRYVLEQHLIEDFGWVPTPTDWMRAVTVTPQLMSRGPAEPENKPDIAKAV
jgi:hypothetical protein